MCDEDPLQHVTDGISIERKPNSLALPLPSHPFPSTTIIHPPAHSAMLPPSLPHTSSRPTYSARSSRHARHISTSTLSEDPDMDGEGEMDVDMDGAAEGEADDTLYCFCQKKSYGEMIGCDNENCLYEWVSFFLQTTSGRLICHWCRS